jgi:hypothetical protein
MPDAAFLLRIAAPVGAGLAAIRLYQDGLYRKYPALLAYLIFHVLDGTFPLFLPSSSNAYFVVYVSTQPLIWVFYVLMVREVYALALASHRGVQTLGRWAMYGAVTVSVVLSLLSILARITPKTPQRSRTIGYIFAFDRGVNFALVLFILLILFFLSRYPVPLSRNVVRHSSLLFIFFLSNAAIILLRSIYGRAASDQISLILTGIATLVIFAWLFLITPAGEEIRKVVGIAPEHEQRILHQLDALNATLLKISRN